MSVPDARKRAEKAAVVNKKRGWKEACPHARTQPGHPPDQPATCRDCGVDL